MKYYSQWNTGLYSIFNCAPTIASIVLWSGKESVKEIRKDFKHPFIKPFELLMFLKNNMLGVYLDEEIKAEYKFNIICLNMFQLPMSETGKDYITPWPWWGHYLLITEHFKDDESVKYWDTWTGRFHYEKKDILDYARKDWNNLVIGIK